VIFVSFYEIFPILREGNQYRVAVESALTKKKKKSKNDQNSPVLSNKKFKINKIKTPTSTP